MRDRAVDATHRRTSGFHTQSELERLVQRRRRRGPSSSQTVDQAIAGRPYQERAVRVVVEHFDAHPVGLTATPKNEVDRNAYRVFQLEEGVPTDVHGLEDTVQNGHLVPPRAVDVHLKYVRGGTRYDELSEEERAAWDETEWNDGGEIPDEVGATAAERICRRLRGLLHYAPAGTHTSWTRTSRMSSVPRGGSKLPAPASARTSSGSRPKPASSSGVTRTT